MKKQILILSLAAMMFTACGQKNKTTQDQDPVQTETTNDYNHLNPGQDDASAKKAEDLSGKVIALTANEFLERVTEIDPALGLRYKGNTPCIVDFYADWCKPCMQLKPITEKLAAKYKGQLIIYKVNVDKAQDICQALSISSIPTLFFFKPNEQPGKMVGAPSEAELDKTIKEFLEK
jgi:thioredoxin